MKRISNNIENTIIINTTNTIFNPLLFIVFSLQYKYNIKLKRIKYNSIPFTLFYIT